MFRNSIPSKRSESVFDLDASVPGGAGGGTAWPYVADGVRKHARRAAARHQQSRALMAFLSGVDLGSDRLEIIQFGVGVLNVPFSLPAASAKRRRKFRR